MSDYYIDVSAFTNKWLAETLNDNGFLFIPESLVSMGKRDPNKYNVDNVAKWLYYHFKRLGKSKIVFADYREGFIIEHLATVNKLYTILNAKYNIHTDSFYYMSCCLHLPINLVKFNKVLQEQQYISMKLLTTNHYEAFYSRDIAKFPNVYGSVDTSVQIKPKKFMCLNGVPRPGRIGLIALLIDRNLIDQGYVSLVTERATDEANEYVTDSVLINKFPKIHNIIHQRITENGILFPMLQSTDLDQYTQELRNSPRMHVISHEDIEMYNTSYFSVVSETSHIAFSGNNPKYALFHDCYHFNEKTYRTMAAMHPFLLGHRPHALKALREVGFKTYHPYIDETYDLIEDDEDRIIALVNEVERLCSFTDEQWIYWQHNVLPIAEHNFNVLKTTGLFKIEGFDESRLA